MALRLTIPSLKVIVPGLQKIARKLACVPGAIIRFLAYTRPTASSGLGPVPSGLGPKAVTQAESKLISSIG